MFDTPALNRRRLLLGIASASAAGAAITVASAAPVAPAENPRLIELAEDLPAIEARYVEALAQKDTAYQSAMKNWPKPPATLLQSKFGSRSLERDVAGFGIKRGDDLWNLWELDDVRNRTSALEQALARPRKNGGARRFNVRYFVGEKSLDAWRSAFDEWNDRLDAAERYYATTTGLREMSGYEPARLAEEAAREALVGHIAAIMAERPNTMSGVVIQAQALAAFGKVGKFFRVCNVESWPWAAAFAETVLSMADDSQMRA